MTASSLDFSSVVAAFPATLPMLVILLKITCLLLAALGATLVMQRAPAGSRHLVWLVALGGLLLLPPLAVWGPLPIQMLPESLAPAPAPGSTESAIGLVAPGSGGAIVTQPSATEPSTASEAGARSIAPSALDPGALLLGLWAVVALGLLGRLAYGAWSVRRIVHRARLLEHPTWQTPLYEIADRLGLESAPRLLQSEEVKMPFAAGLLSSTIVLPAESEQWTADRRSAVLIHELGHVRRRDLIGHTLSRIVCALYWFHPLVWTAARRLRAESERACDDLALVFGARPSDYAEHLLDIVTCVRDHNTPAVALAMAHRREFEGRMLAILNPELRRRGPTRTETASLVGSLAVLALLVGAAAPVPRVSAPVQRPSLSHRGAESSQGDTTPAPVVLPTVPLTPRQVATPNPVVSPAPTAVPSVPNAAQVRGAVADDERATVLARTLRSDSSAEVRRVAAWGLQRYARSEVAVEALAAALGGDADESVREMSAWSLAGAGKPAATTALLGAIRRDRSAQVRATAVWAVGSMGDPSAVEVLVGVLGDADPNVRELAAWAIGSAGPDQAPAALTRALTDQNRDVRLSVAWALFNIGDSGTTAPIEAAFRRESDREVQLGLIKALGRMGELSVETLERLVSSPDAEIRTVAVTALAGGNATGPWPWPRPEPRPFP